MIGAAPGAGEVSRRSLRMLLRTIVWDLQLQIRYHIVTVAIVVTALYAAIFRAVPAAAADKVVLILIFSDPSMLGFIFIGSLVLFELGANTLQALAVTPLSSSQYLLSKAISLTLIALPSGFVMALAGHGPHFNHAVLAVAITMTSMFFVFLGFAGVARVRTVNEYLLMVPAMLTPLTLPLLSFFGITRAFALYLIPSQASLILFQAAFEPRPTWEILYAVGFLFLALIAAFVWARRSFEGRVRGSRGAR